MKKNKMYMSCAILFIFLFVFVVGVNKTSANGISNNVIFKKIKKINSMENIDTVSKIKRIKETMNNANEKELKIYNMWQIVEINNAIEKLNAKIEENDFVTSQQKYSLTLDDGTPISIRIEDVAVNSDETAKAEAQTNIWKDYGNRRYTYTINAFIGSISLINGYTVGANGLSTRYVDTSFYAFGLKIDSLSYRWDENPAIKIGDKINAKAKWQISGDYNGIDVSGIRFQKAYLQIINWDKKNKKMLIGKSGSLE